MRTKTEQVCEALRGGDMAAMLEVLGWQTEVVAIEHAAWRAWGWFGEPLSGAVVAQQSGCRALAVHGPPDRRAVLSVARQAPLDTVLWFFVEDDIVTFAVATMRDGKQRVRTLEVTREEPAAMALDRLLRLDRADFARPELDASAATRSHIDELLDQEEMTRAFFQRFSAALRQMARTVENGPSSPDDRWHSALVVLLRLIFLYFLQRELLLDGDPRYVIRRLRLGDDTFFDTTLRPLFFGVLNTPPEHRDEAAQRLGDVPFLNGGLFEPTPIEVAFPELSWPTEVLREVIEDVFEHFHFTAAEPAGSDEACVVDPEMLGKVFEGLMFGDDRRDSGAFYTPRDVVSGMVERALDGYVADREADGIPADVALETVRVLDPAVGTGAFLLEALNSLRRRRREAGLSDGYDDVRRLVHAHLYGVDCNRTAVRLCELRIWLVMLTLMRNASGPLEPLPNLSHRIVAGDSLLDGISALRSHQTLPPEHLDTIRDAEHRLETAQRTFLQAHGPEKIAARRELQDAEREVERTSLCARRARVDQRLEPLMRAADSRDLFGEPAVSAQQTASIASLLELRADLDERLRRVDSERGGAPGFSYLTRFGAAAREGFDVIVTNPPWVRAQRVDRATRDALATRYQAASGHLWPGAKELGIRTPYGAQPDLAALFVERSMELLRPGGRLAALVPAKLFRALHAAPMRRLLCEHAVESIEDLSDADRQLFDATVYPGILHVRKDRAANDAVDVRVWRGANVEESTCDRLPGLAPAPGAPWLLAPRAVTETLDRVRERSTPLGLRPDAEPQRGIFTGANAVFVRPKGGFVAELGPDAEPFVRPLLRGSGLGEAPQTEILWCYEGANPLGSIPAPLHDYFESHRDVLTHRSDYREDSPLWQVFRARADEDRPRVAWRDMSVFLDPVVVAAGPVAANTVYYVGFDDLQDAFGFARWMASLPVRAVAYGIAERARGGWRRHFAWVVRMLPVPQDLDRWADFDADRHFALTPADREILSTWLTGSAGLEAA